MHAFVFSDHVDLADEVALKTEAAARGLLVMGPDCGTAVVAGVPLGFANAVRPGPVGLVGASGTGLQQVACLLHARGSGVSHVLGTGSRDVSREVGGLTMLAALDALAADPATERIVLVSKPPDPEVAPAASSPARRHAAHPSSPASSAGRAPYRRASSGPRPSRRRRRRRHRGTRRARTPRSRTARSRVPPPPRSCAPSTPAAPSPTRPTSSSPHASPTESSGNSPPVRRSCPPATSSSTSATTPTRRAARTP